MPTTPVSTKQVPTTPVPATATEPVTRRIDGPPRILLWLACPPVSIALGVGLSMIAWSLPAASSAGKGFVAQSPPMMDLIRTVGAYGFILAAAACGYRIGCGVGRRFRGVPIGHRLDLTHTTIWNAILCLAVIGVTATTLKIVTSMGVTAAIREVMTFNANAFKFAIYEGYSRGLLTMRYFAIPAAAIAIFRYLTFGHRDGRTYLSFVLLAVMAIVSSRLSIIAATTGGGLAYLWYPIDRPRRTITMRTWAIWLALFVVSLGALTISRTYGFYRRRGADNVVSAVASEFQRYLAAPFQGGIEAVNHGGLGSRLSDFAGIERTLSTNSSLMYYAIAFGSMGVWALTLTVAISSLACGILRQYANTYYVFAAGTLTLCHLEIWRMPLYMTGLIATLLFGTTILPAVVASFRWPTLRLPMIRLRIGGFS